MVVAADVGLKTPGSDGADAGVVQVSVGSGSRDMTAGPALSLPQVNDALLVGMNLASIEISRGLDVLIVGSVHPARHAALACLQVLTERPLGELTSSEQEQQQIEQALTINQPDRLDPPDVLRTVGGLDIAALTGLILTGAAGRVPVILDGLAAVAAGVVAAHLSPAVRAYLLAGQRSGDPALDVGLRTLGLRPLLDLAIQDAPGCGGVLALHLVEAAARVVNEAAEKKGD